MGLMQVAPTPNTGNSSEAGKQKHVRSVLWTRQVVSLGRRIVAGYNKLQVSHRGMYSIERLQAFQLYCDKTSVTRAIAVCVLTPVPSLLAMVLIECIPLCDPELGWRANYMFWLRFFVSGVIIIIGSTYQVVDMMDRIRLSAVQCLRVAIFSMVVYVATVLGIAMLWVFPVPFGIVVGIGPCFAFFLTVLVLTIGIKTFRENSGLSRELKAQLYVLATEATIAVIYPAFSSLYLRTSPNNRAGLVLLLPLTKLLMKNVVAWASSHVEDYVPLVAVFSIEVFNALYVSTCMQSTKSTLATIVIISCDVLSGALSFYSLLGRTRAIQDQQQRSTALYSESKNSGPGKLIPAAVTASRLLRTFQTKKGKTIRIRSPLQLGLGAEAERVLDSLRGHQIKFMTRAGRKASRKPSRTATGGCGPSRALFQSDSKQRPALIGPFEPCALSRKQPTVQGLSIEEQRVTLVGSTLELLFHCEYHALVEYVECTIPVLFGVYSSILCQLPTHKYYPHTRDMVPGQLEGMLTSLVVYVGLEVLSFVALHVALKRKFNLSALFQLAFVLETHVVQLQSRLFVWIVFILQFTLQHYGVDFTFQFAWVH
ncbi:hypothetical protein PHYPSEUDO_015500 [Phytophthora pseudosyringae]|uniref:Uncharacterized protein n=1 Tax=Phytophthora pseudosyringae TaxID=221518 RepID=A0A8T1VYN0_9STRA|nr:hypothetical protein PHYPSEUDO_015500 [Phytophthora pseudosyringae]